MNGFDIEAVFNIQKTFKGPPYIKSLALSIIDGRLLLGNPIGVATI